MWTRILSLSIVFVLGTAYLVTAQSSEQVNTNAVQTLTNKTLTAPTITNPVITGTVTGGASFAAITLTSPTLSGVIGGSASWDSPGAIGAGTAATGRFSTLTATTALVVGTPTLKSGIGSPEGAITSTIGSQFLRTDGGTGTTLYVKESGAGNTGWVAVSAGGAVTWTVPGTIGSATPNTGAFTTLSVTGAVTSTLSTGTAPFTISSTTKVSNLNVDLLDGSDWTSPSAIGTTTPAAGTFTTLSANSMIVVGTPMLRSGTGSPEGVVTAPVSSVYLRTDGAAGTVIYSKEAGTGNAGWVAVSPGTVAWGAPGAIGTTTPNSGSFTGLNAFKFIYYIQASTYGATVPIDAGNGQYTVITATNSTPFTISNPTSPAAGMTMMIQVKNASGAALGAITWDTLYKMAVFTKPANGFRRTVTFLYDGTVWVELNCSPEVPN